MYDRLVHYTDAEYEELTGQKIDVQALVECPYLHLLVAGSSSASDHLAFTADRLDCVRALSTTVQAPDGTEVTDVLSFFNEDKVAQWIEGGAKQEGTTSVVHVGYPVSPSLMLPAAIESCIGVLLMPKPMCLLVSTEIRRTV